MKKLKIILIVIAWVVSGITGGIRFELKYHDLTVGGLVGIGISGAVLGPTMWLIYLASSDVVLIKQKG